MKIRVLSAFAATIGMLASVTMAQAQFFDYTASITPDPIVSSNQSGSQINVFNYSKQNLYAGGNGTEITIANFTTTSSASASNPALVDSPYTVSLLLTKHNAQTTQDLPQTMSGRIHGSFSTTNSNLMNDYNTTPLTFNFGNGELYTVKLDGWVAPGSSNQGLQGALTAHVFGPSVNPTATNTPEPGTWALLLGMGTTGLAVGYRRRRQQA